MRGQEFLDWLDKAAEQADSTGAAAKATRDLISTLGAATREAIATRDGDSAIVEALTKAAKSHVERLDAVSTDGTALIAVYNQEQVPAGGAKPAFADWLQTRKQQGGDEKAKAERLDAFLNEPGREQLRDKVLQTQDGDALRNAVTVAQEELRRRSADAQTVVGVFANAHPAENKVAPGHFLDYLATLEAQGDKDAQELRKLLTGSRIEAKILSNDVQLHEILGVIDARTQGWFPGAKKVRLKAAAVDYLTRFLEVPTTAAASPSPAQPASGGGWPQWLSIGAIIFATMLIIGVFLRDDSKLLLLSETAPARGFITFIFTVGTIALFLVITAATVFDSRSDGQQQYERAKTILSMLIGIFGTVLGFYFGLSEERQGTEEFAVRPIEITKEGLESGAVDLRASVDGGEPPYTFYVKVIDANGTPTDHTTFISSASGALARSLNLVDLIENGPTEVTIAVHAEDARNTKSATQTATAPIGKHSTQ